MDAEQRSNEHELPFESHEHKQNLKSFPTTTDIFTDNSDSFACNICLDSAYDPVVTLCGHLYCWPCIYKWLHISNSSDDQQPNCPVCKSNLSINSLVPLYGRSDSISKKDTSLPQRPSPTYVFQPQPQPYPFHYHQTTQTVSPTIGMFGELIFARVFGSPGTNLFAYSYPDSNSLMGRYSHPRTRRQEMQLDKSLNRVSIFLFCCIVLCLLLF